MIKMSSISVEMRLHEATKQGKDETTNLVWVWKEINLSSEIRIAIHRSWRQSYACSMFHN